MVSFGSGDLEWVKQYIRNQREHHACGKVYERLERITQQEPWNGRSDAVRSHDQDPRERG